MALPVTVPGLGTVPQESEGNRNLGSTVLLLLDCVLIGEISVLSCGERPMSRAYAKSFADV
jgi:hypothetical protein